MKKPYFERAILGNTPTADFTSSMLPATRKAQLGHLLKTKPIKLYWVHLLTVLFFLPLMIWDYLSVNYTNTAFSGSAEQNLTALPNYALTVFGIAVPLWMIAFVGLSGGLYVLRRYAWGDHVSIGRDFAKGIKNSGVQSAFVGFAFATLLAIFKFAFYWLGFYQKLDNGNFGYMIGQVSAVVAIGLLGMITVYVLNVVNLYNVTFLQSWWAGLKLFFGKFWRSLGVMALSFAPIILPFLFAHFYVKLIGYGIVIVGGLGFAVILWVQLSLSVTDEQINKTDYPDNYLKGLSGGKVQSLPKSNIADVVPQEQPTESDFEVLD